MSYLLSAMTSVLVVMGPQDHVTWPFTITSAGEDASWTSPSQVNPKGGFYEMLYIVESAQVMVSYIGIDFGPIDITDMLPEDVLATWRESEGPCALDFGWIEVIAPEDQDPPSFAYDWILELDAKGTATHRFTNVFMGQADYDLGWPWGTVTVNVEEGTLNGFITIDIVPTPCYADVDGSGTVDVVDLLEIIGNWGYCLECPEDPNNDDVIDVTDLLIVVGAWGDCPK